MTLGPPLWATGSWATDAWADGSWASSVAAPSTLDDLTTVFVPYLASLLAAHGGTDDVSTQLAGDLLTVRAASTAGNLDDANTMYCVYLSPLF